MYHDETQKGGIAMSTNRWGSARTWSHCGLIVAVVLTTAVAVAQETPHTDLGVRLAEHHGEGAFIRLEDVKLRERVVYRDGAALGALKTPA